MSLGIQWRGHGTAVGSMARDRTPRPNIVRGGLCVACRTEQGFDAYMRPGGGCRGARGMCRTDCGARGRRWGLAGLRGDAPSEARGADGERAGRRPRAHQAARPSRRPEHQRHQSTQQQAPHERAQAYKKPTSAIGCRPVVELGGFEPPTFSLRTRRATNCAIAPRTRTA